MYGVNNLCEHKRTESSYFNRMDKKKTPVVSEAWFITLMLLFFIHLLFFF